MELTYTKQVNAAKLDQELKAALDGIVQGVSTGPGELLRVHVDDAITQEQQDQVSALVAAHDPSALTTDQQEAAESDTARDTLRQQVAARIAWHEANPVTDQASALAALQRMQTEWVLLLKYMRRQL